MSVQKLEQWAARSVSTFQLSALKDATIGVDASFYLDCRINQGNEEPLKHALGGIPFCLKRIVEDDIKALKEASIKLVFVFNGLDFVSKEQPTLFASHKAQQDAWYQYDRGDAKSPVDNFQKAVYPVETLIPYFQKLLHDNEVDFMVAPYSAVAQLSCLEKLSDQYIDAVMASPTECFLFNIDKAIVNFNINNSTFDWLSKSVLEERLKVNGDLFRDALLLQGSSFIPAFPLLSQRHGPQASSISEALGYLNRANGSVLQLCDQYQENPDLAKSNYAYRYKKAVMTIKHHVVMQKDGVVQPLDFDHAPGDVHEFIGHRLPEELFFYLSKGLIGPDVPNWLTLEKISVQRPGGVEGIDAYRRLVTEQLNPVRTQALKLLAEPLTFYYQNKIVKVAAWPESPNVDIDINLRQVPVVRPRASTWKIKESDLPTGNMKAGKSLHVLPLLQLLKDKKSAEKTITRSKVPHPALTSQTEVLSNMMLRFLHIREYINDNHELTRWGRALEAALAAVEGSGNTEELALLAVEMLRMGLFSGASLAAKSPSPGKEPSHEINVNLISKIACLGRLKHKAMGYVGPLDRPLLTFAWMVTAVRTSLRSLVESVLVSMFLNGEVERDRTDWVELATSLPFTSDNGSALGVLTKTYLDALRDESTEVTDDLKEKIKSQDEKFSWFGQVKGGTLHKSLDLAFNLFDVVCAAAEVADKDFRDAKLFSEAKEWLKPMR